MLKLEKDVASMVSSLQDVNATTYPPEGLYLLYSHVVLKSLLNMEQTLLENYARLEVNCLVEEDPKLASTKERFYALV